ncbi:hypothetical protein [Opitutus sp. ER46]|uniref:hypothetical protein n=1 Tax=Opitutus sp. ER46 TaxID=2161864 RepID=UPI000D2FCF9C|nr:hypothetical protein [Opitutus sp. ER46]PTX90635.1 hypothetical protein DB354_18355 [Opitutus sp. ER46]
MNHVHSSSLAATLDSVADALFFRRPISTAERSRAAGWIAGRQGLPGAYADMFAPTRSDWRGIRLFTGEVVRTGAGVGHQLGEEGCRILTVLKVRNQTVSGALRRAVAGMSAQLAATEQRGHSTSCYCCGTCSAAYWRNLATGLFPEAEERLRRGLQELSRLRTEDGGWSRFPFYFTSLALLEIPDELARRELKYAAPRWERILPRLSRSDRQFDRRRVELGRRLLARCAE